MTGHTNPSLIPREIDWEKPNPSSPYVIGLLNRCQEQPFLIEIAYLPAVRSARMIVVCSKCHSVFPMFIGSARGRGKVCPKCQTHYGMGDVVFLEDFLKSYEKQVPITTYADTLRHSYRCPKCNSGDLDITLTSYTCYQCGYHGNGLLSFNKRLLIQQLFQILG